MLPTRLQKEICAVYGEGNVTDQKFKEWFAKFYNGDFSLNEVPWSGKSVEVDTNQKT